MADPCIESLERMLEKGHISVDQYIQGLAALTPQEETPAAKPAALSKSAKTNARKRASRKRKALLLCPTEQPPAAPELLERVLPARDRRGAKRVHLRPKPDPEPEPEPEPEPDVALKWIVVRTYEAVAGQTRIRDSTMDVPMDHPSAQDPRVLIDLAEPLTVARLTKDRRVLGGMKGKLGMTFQVTKTQIDAGGTQSTTTDEVSRWGKMTALSAATTEEELAEFVAVNCAKILEEIEKYLQNGSGWAIDRVLHFDLKLDRYAPIRGASYLPTPKWIVNKKCCINVRNVNQDCFRYALTAAIDRPARNTERPGYYDDARRPRFDLSGIEMPARCCSDTFKRFERQNPDYSLTIFECPTKSKGREDLQPAYVGDESRANQITLILLYDAKAGAEHTRHHYITVSNIQALLRGDAHNEEAHCLRCLHTFAGVGAASRLAQHRP